MKLEMATGDMSEWREADFALNCTYIVPDQVSDPSFRLPKAMTSIPRNLTFEYSTDNEVTGVFSKEYIPQGTRFGPLQGDVYAKDSVPKQANRKYFWRIYRGGQLNHFIDGYDVHRSNWMRYVNPAHSLSEQNLVACQNGRDVYFYTIRPVEPKQELLVWYSQEFAKRLCSQQDHVRQKHVGGADEDSEPEGAKQRLLPQQQTRWFWERTREEVKAESCEDAEEKIDVEALERDTPPDTPHADQIVDFSAKMEEEAKEKEREDRESDHNKSPPPSSRHSPQPRLPAIPSPHRDLPLHLHGLYGDREGLVSSSSPYPVYPPPHTRPLQPPYQLLPSPYSPHYPRLLLPQYSPPFPSAMSPPCSSLRYGSYLGADGLPYHPTIAGQPGLLPPVSLPYHPPLPHPHPQGGLKERTVNMSPPCGAPATPELSPVHKSDSQNRTPPPPPPAAPHQSPSGCDEAMNLSLAVSKANAAPRIGPGYKSLPYPLKKQNGKIKYECNVCLKTFGQLSNLKVHLRVHSGERPFHCNLCKKSFTQLAHLQKHHLVHTGEKPHECQVCHKRFSSTSNLKTHLRLHSGEKPYECKLCSTKFTQYIHLKLHRRLHSARERAHRCQPCGQAFLHRFSLHVHQRSCCPATATTTGGDLLDHAARRARDIVEQFDASQEADGLPEAASPAQVEAAAERWLARSLEGREGKEDQKEAALLLKALVAAINAPPARQERASVVHLYGRPAIKTEGQ